MKQKNTAYKPLLGAHISASGGLYKAFARAVEIGCTTMQIFTKSNQQWYAKPLTEEEINQFIQTTKEYKDQIHPVIVHAAYLINICSDNKETEKKSVAGLIVELKRCEALQIPYLVFHPGSAGSNSQQTAQKQLQKNLDLVLQEASGETKVLLENMAGQGSSVAHTIDTLAQTITGSSYHKHLGICIDTCHAFAAGYDIAQKESFEAFFSDIDTKIGLNQLHVLHLNDSKYSVGEKKDRHADIGKGKIGLDPFSWIMNDPRFFGIPKIIETPHETPEDDKRNLNTLYNLLQ
jgi:deoxyribonuclease IV